MLMYYYSILIALFISATKVLSAKINLTDDNYGVQDRVLLNDRLYGENTFVPDIPMSREKQTWDYSAEQAISFISPPYQYAI